MFEVLFLIISEKNHQLFSRTVKCHANKIEFRKQSGNIKLHLVSPDKFKNFNTQLNKMKSLGNTNGI